MSVQLKILYGNDFERCKVQNIEKQTLACLSLEDFESVIRQAVGNYVSGIQTVRIQYRDDEGTFVTMKDDLDLNDAMRCMSSIPNTEGKFRLCLRVNDVETPEAAGRKKNLPVNETKIHSFASRKRLHFNVGEDSALPINKQTFTCTSTPTAENHPANDGNKILTPIQRYIEKTKENLKEKELRIQELLHKEENIKSKLEEVRMYSGSGNTCHNCHLKLSHTARNCSYEKCDSVYKCGEQRFHVGELNLKQLRNSIIKLEKEKQQLAQELENKKAAAVNVRDSVVNNLESQLLELDPSSLLRKHVFHLKKYCETTLKGHIPPKQDILKYLQASLSEDQHRYPTLLKQAKQRENPAKMMLERHGIQFPSTSTNNDYESCSPVQVDYYAGIQPRSKEEEEEQIKLALCASVATERNTNNRSFTTTATSTLPENEAEPAEKDEEMAANVLVSLCCRN